MFTELHVPPSLSALWFRRIPLSQFQVAPSRLLCGSVLYIPTKRKKNRHSHFGFTVKFGFIQENGFNRIIDDWIIITWHSEVRRHASLSRLTNSGFFFNVTVGSAGCTFARLGMSRSVGFNRAANDLTALACYKSPFSLCKEHARYWCITDENLGSNGTACGM